MMFALATLVTALWPPDPTPAVNAVQACDRRVMNAITRAEPHRRAEYATALYNEVRALAAEFAAIGAPAASPREAAGRAAALALFDIRRKQIEDVRLAEATWRDALDELRGDFLARCAAGGDGVRTGAK